MGMHVGGGCHSSRRTSNINAERNNEHTCRLTASSCPLRAVSATSVRPEEHVRFVPCSGVVVVLFVAHGFEELRWRKMIGHFRRNLHRTGGSAQLNASQHS